MWQPLSRRRCKQSYHGFVDTGSAAVMIISRPVSPLYPHMEYWRRRYDGRNNFILKCNEYDRPHKGVRSATGIHHLSSAQPTTMCTMLLASRCKVWFHTVAGVVCVLHDLTVCYTEKATEARHRLERQYNAGANRKKQCRPNETKPYSNATHPRKRQNDPTNGHNPSITSTHTRRTYTGTRPHAPGHQAGDHPVPAHTESHNPSKAWTQRQARTPPRAVWGGGAGVGGRCVIVTAVLSMSFGWQSLVRCL